MLATAKHQSLLIELFQTGTHMSYKKGEFVIRPGQMPPGVIYLENGLVKAYDITKYGEENLLIIRKSGEFLALTWAITGEDRHIIYEALAPTAVRIISRKVFVEYIQNNPEAALPIVDLITNMYRLHSQRILNLEYRSVRERIISFLLTTAQRFGRAVDGGILIDVPLKHQDIASSINATRETTSRAITQLEKAGLLTNKQSLFILHDIEKLQKYLS